MLAKLKAALAKIKATLAHSAIVDEVKDALSRIHDEALADVHEALAKAEVVEPKVAAAVEAAVKQAIEAVAADIVGSL